MKLRPDRSSRGEDDPAQGWGSPALAAGFSAVRSLQWPRSWPRWGCPPVTESHRRGRPDAGDRPCAGSHLRAESTGAPSLLANRTATGSWEQFDLLNVSSGNIALRAHANNMYVTADNAGASPLIANRTAIGTWEQFDLITN
jgi:hypothetical protein